MFGHLSLEGFIGQLMESEDVEKRVSVDGGLGKECVLSWCASKK